jgi:hypothetical protein
VAGLKALGDSVLPGHKKGLTAKQGADGIEEMELILYG